MDNLRNKAKELFESKTVDLIIGYEKGTNDRARAVFISDPLKTDTLIYDERCKQNLGVYLVKREIKQYGKIAIVATLPVMRTVLVLISECQVKPENLVVLGISEEGKLLDFPSLDILETYVSKANLDTPSPDKEKLVELNAMSLSERREFWNKELERCFKCYACRAACPMCYCNRCTVECNQPQWISVPANPLGNLEWHMLRTMHLTGRCVSCGDCGRACPLEIPVHLLTMQQSEAAFEMFGVHAGTSMKAESALSTFKPDDNEDFIL
jgi:formate dehydrogenase (coenzyme F420) beta subunit